jgi:MFS family permease
MIRTTVFSAGAKTNLARSAWLAWSVAALFYAYEFFQRLAPSAMESALTHSLALSAEAFGSLGACYFYAYAIAQLPTGLLFDNYGIKRTLIGASLLVALGSLLFALAPGLWLAQLARVLVGLGSAFAFLGCLQIARAGFSEQWLPIVIGLTNSLGIVGALFAEKPLTAFIAATDWRVTMLAAALFGVLLTGLMIMGLGSQQLRQTTASPGLKLGWQRLANQLMKVLANPLSWIVALIAALRVVPVISFGELWAPAFFRQSFAIDPQAAATIVSFLFIGIGVGGPVNGWLANYLGRYNWLLITGLGSLVGLLLILYPPLTSL